MRRGNAGPASEAVIEAVEDVGDTGKKGRGIVAEEIIANCIEHGFVQEGVLKFAVYGFDDEGAVVREEKEGAGEAETVDGAKLFVKLLLVAFFGDIVDVVAEVVEEERSGTVEVDVVE